MEAENSQVAKRRASLDRLASFGRSGRDLTPSVASAATLQRPPALQRAPATRALDLGGIDMSPSLKGSQRQLGVKSMVQAAPPLDHLAQSSPVKARPRSMTRRAAAAEREAAEAEGAAAKLLGPLVDLVVHLFSRCADPENFYWAVLDPTFPLAEHRNAVINRIGWLNVLDVRNPEIEGYDLDLRVPDHWKVAHMLTQLAAVEPGLNFKDPTFRRTHALDPIPGWDLPANWDVERYDGNLPKGIPTDGALTLDYDCDEDDLELRRSLAEAFTIIRIPRPKVSAIENATLLSE